MSIYKNLSDAVGPEIALGAAQPKQQAEPPPEWPLIKNILAVFGLDAISFVAKWKAAQQKAEPVAWMDKHGNIDHGLDAIFEPEGWKPLYTIPVYTTPPQRQWQGLEAEDLAQIENDEFWQTGNHMAIAVAVEAKLKERNT